MPHSPSASDSRALNRLVWRSRANARSLICRTRSRQMPMESPTYRMPGGEQNIFQFGRTRVELSGNSFLTTGVDSARLSQTVLRTRDLPQQMLPGPG